LALYYYSNGRPISEINQGYEDHGTLFKNRAGVDKKQMTGLSLNKIVRDLVPPIIMKGIRKIRK
jgi:hypothetical protein